MKGDAKIVDHLNTALQMELTAVQQYLLHAHILADWGLAKLSAKMKEEMQEELDHADRFLARVVFLEGDPKVAPKSGVTRAQSLKDMFRADLADEIDARKFYTLAAKESQEAGDLGSHALFAGIAADEEGHIAWLENQLSLLDRLGEVAFTQMYLDPEAEE